MTSALIVPVPEVEALVGSIRAQHDPAAAAGIPAHVTILYPFMTDLPITPQVVDDIATLLMGRERFVFSLVETGRFDSTLYLVPQPGDPFVELTGIMHDHWPEYPPYGGAFPDLIPHLTVAHGDPGMFDWLETDLEAALPVQAVASSVTLMTERDGLWSQTGSFPLA